MNAKTLFTNKARKTGYTAADMATASADGWRAGQLADNALLRQCREVLLDVAQLLYAEKLAAAQPLLDVDVQATLSALDERLA